MTNYSQYHSYVFNNFIGNSFDMTTDVVMSQLNDS